MSKESVINKINEMLGEYWDCFDTESEYDSNLTDEENLTILKEKIQPLLKTDVKAVAKDLKLKSEMYEEQNRQEFERFKENNIFKDYLQLEDNFINSLFDKPKILGIVADVNNGKSMLIYNILEKIKDRAKLYTFGLKANLGISINSLEELERCKNSIIIIDEFDTLFDLTDRRKARQIERTLRLINHKNNIIILCGVGQNFKKFISNKLDGVFIKKITLGDCINGSRVKQICLNYRGYELGETILDIPLNQVLFYNGERYDKYEVKYLEKYDSKLNNKPILKNVQEKMSENVEKKCSEKGSSLILMKGGGGVNG
jgi:hypothetical protein